MIAGDLRRRRPKPHTTWHLDEVYLKINGRTVYLWRAVDAEGEVLDVLVQSKRTERAALKLMRKLLKKYGLCQISSSRMISNLTLPQSKNLESQNGTSEVDGATTGPRTPINRLDDESGRCRVSRVRAQPKDFFQLTQPHTIRSTSSAISYQQEPTAPSGRRR